MLDDLKNARQLEEIALAYYNGGKDSICAREMSPKTFPLVTLNWEVLDGISQDYQQVLTGIIASRPKSL